MQKSTHALMVNYIRKIIISQTKILQLIHHLKKIWNTAVNILNRNLIHTQEKLFDGSSLQLFHDKVKQ